MWGYRTNGQKLLLLLPSLPRRSLFFLSPTCTAVKVFNPQRLFPLGPKMSEQQQEGGSAIDRLLSLIDKAKTAMATKDYASLADAMIEIYDLLEESPTLGVEDELEKLPEEMRKKLKESREIRNLLSDNNMVEVEEIDFVLPSEDLKSSSKTMVVEEGGQLKDYVTKLRDHNLASEISSLRRKFNYVLNEIAENRNPAHGSKGKWIIKPWLSEEEKKEGLEILNGLLEQMIQKIKDYLVKKREEEIKRAMERGELDAENAKTMIENMKKYIEQDLRSSYYINVVPRRVPAGSVYLDRLRSLLGSFAVIGGAGSDLTPPNLLRWSRDSSNRQQVLNLVRNALINHYKANYYKLNELEDFLDGLEERLKAIKNILEESWNIDYEALLKAEEEEEKEKDKDKERKDLLPA